MTFERLGWCLAWFLLTCVHTLACVCSCALSWTDTGSSPAPPGPARQPGSELSVSDTSRHLMFKSDKSAQVRTDTPDIGVKIKTLFPRHQLLNICSLISRVIAESRSVTRYVVCAARGPRVWPGPVPGHRLKLPRFSYTGRSQHQSLGQFGS